VRERGCLGRVCVCGVRGGDACRAEAAARHQGSKHLRKRIGGLYGPGRRAPCSALCLMPYVCTVSSCAYMCVCVCVCACVCVRVCVRAGILACCILIGGKTMSRLFGELYARSHASYNKHSMFFFFLLYFGGHVWYCGGRVWYILYCGGHVCYFLYSFFCISCFCLLCFVHMFCISCIFVWPAFS